MRELEQAWQPSDDGATIAVHDQAGGAAPAGLAEPRLGTVTADNADRTISLTTYDGAQMWASGQLQQPIPYNVWVSGGRLLGAAPNLPLVEVVV